VGQRDRDAALQPVRPVSGQSALVNTQSTWNSAGSSFPFVNGGTTSTCPSLIPGCAGGQRPPDGDPARERPVLGLDHSNDTGAMMYPSYQQADCTLGQDDINGIRALYP
jgi:hypothetical protein